MCLEFLVPSGLPVRLVALVIYLACEKCGKCKTKIKFNSFQMLEKIIQSMINMNRCGISSFCCIVRAFMHPQKVTASQNQRK